MKLFLIKVCFLFGVVIIADMAFGQYMKYIINQIDVGGQGRDNYICNQCEEDILVFGSSRAVHHYNATMLEDSLKLSCYNCGDDGNGIILSYGRFVMAKERHVPQIVILDIFPIPDLFKSDNSKFLGWLKSRYDRKGISTIFDDVDKTERYKMKSQMYRYNSRFLQNLFVYFTSISSGTGIKGYRPINLKFDPMKIKHTQEEKYEFDSLKIEYIEKFIDLSKNTQLYFVVSPIWYGMDTAKLLPIYDIAKERNIPFLDFSNDPKYVHNNLYFKDGTHLNATGADEFTKDLIKKMKNIDVKIDSLQTI